MKLTTAPQGTPIELARYLDRIVQQLNAITEGNQHAHHAAMTSAPTTGTWAIGDFVLNSAPAESSGGLEYIVHGWRCTVSGTPGTWVEMRMLTGGGLDITKLLTATATLDFPSIGSNSTESLTITVTGATTADHVLIVPPSTLEAGLTAIASISAADTVTVKVHNSSGGSVDPASATWRATVMAFG